MHSSRPKVSVLMPTFKQALFLPRAVNSLLAQTWTDWELVVVDDGSPDATGAAIAPFLGDRRIRYHRLARNVGLGAALRYALGEARGEYIAYLPSDDFYLEEHLARLVAVLDSRPDVYLAYGGVRWHDNTYGATLQGDAAVGREVEALRAGNSGVVLAQEMEALGAATVLSLVQVAHRRELEDAVLWPTREEIVCDDLEARYWLALAERGARFAYSGALTCHWTKHSDQRHRIIAGVAGGLYRYRHHYGVGEQWLNFEPTRGMAVDERARFGPLRCDAAPRDRDPLHILVAGELGFNPERLLALEERGHRVTGLWLPRTEQWDAVGPFPFGHIESILFEPGWEARVRAARPDVIYGLLNWHVLPMLEAVLDARLGIPFVFHFKEAPQLALDHGVWPTLARLLRETQGQVFISEENFAWLQHALGGALSRETAFILDGDLPKLDWFGDDFAAKLSDQDGEIHTVVTGRPLGLDPFTDLAANGIHVHLYGRAFHQWFPNWSRAGVATGYLHIHPTVEPSQWVSELSRYDAAWFHVFPSANQGDIRLGSWDDLNLPARLGTYAAAGLPWILKDNRPAAVVIQDLALRHDCGLLFRDFADLAAQLRDRPRLRQLTVNMMDARKQFAFDTHADALVGFFRQAMTRAPRRAGAAATPRLGA